MSRQQQPEATRRSQKSPEAERKRQKQRQANRSSQQQPASVMSRQPGASGRWQVGGEERGLLLDASLVLRHSLSPRQVCVCVCVCVST